MSESADVGDPAGVPDATDVAVAGGDLSDAPVPDLDRISRCTCSVRGSGTQVELWGPPAGILSIARWLRAPSGDVAALAGGPRSDWQPGAGRISIVAEEVGPTDDDGLVGLSVADGCFTITGSVAALSRLGEVVESIGVYALDLRWSPVERRQLVVAEGPAPRAGADGTAGPGEPGIELLRPGSPSGGEDAAGPGEPGVALLRPGSPSLLIASAYPRDP